jgi:hypothetical protein
MKPDGRDPYQQSELCAHDGLQDVRVSYAASAWLVAPRF